MVSNKKNSGAPSDNKGRVGRAEKKAEGGSRWSNVSPDWTEIFWGEIRHKNVFLFLIVSRSAPEHETPRNHFCSRRSMQNYECTAPIT